MVVRRSAPSAAAASALESPPAGGPAVFKESAELKSFIGKRGLQGKRCRVTQAAGPEVLKSAIQVQLGANSFDNAQKLSDAFGWAIVRGFAIFGESTDEAGPWCAHPRAWNEKPSGTWVDLTARAPDVGELVLLESAQCTDEDALSQAVETLAVPPAQPVAAALDAKTTSALDVKQPLSKPKPPDPPAPQPGVLEERDGDRLVVVRFQELETPAGCARLAAALIRDAMVLVEPPAAERVEQKRARCVSEAEAFFAKPREQQLPHGPADGPGGFVGFQANDEHQHAIFEVKRQHDPRFPWPSEPMRGALTSFRELLHDAARACLRALAQPEALDLDLAAVEATLDHRSCADRTMDGLEGASSTAMRIWLYQPKCRGSEWHCDTTLLTIAPRATVIGLGTQRADGKHLWPEQQMVPGQLLLFAGDALSFITRGRVPALVHCVVPPRCKQRCSMPFFLRPRMNAVLRRSRCAPRLAHGEADPEPAALLSCKQTDIEKNGIHTYEVWPWKRGDYYHDAVWAKFGTESPPPEDEE